MDPINFLVIVGVLLLILCVFNTFGQKRSDIVDATTTALVTYLLTLAVLAAIVILKHAAAK